MEVRTRRSIKWALSILLVVCVAGRWWYSHEARKARQVVAAHDARYKAYMDKSLKDPDSYRDGDVDAIVRDGDLARAEQDRLRRTSETFYFSALGFGIAILVTASLFDRADRRRERQDAT